MRVGVGSLRAFFFMDPSFGFGVIDSWGEDWKREDIGVLLGLGPLNVGFEMVQDGSSIRVLDVLWALGRAAKALPSLFEDRDPLEERSFIFEGELTPEQMLRFIENAGQMGMGMELSEMPPEILRKLYGTADRQEILRMIRGRGDDDGHE